MSWRKTRRAECPGRQGKNQPPQGGTLQSVQCSARSGERKAEDGPLDSACGGHRMVSVREEQFQRMEMNAWWGFKENGGHMRDCEY